MMKLRYFAAVCCVLAGCGGNPSADMQNSSLSIQKMKSGGRVALGDATQTSPAPTGTFTIAGYRSNFTIVKDQVSSVVTVTNNISKAVQTYDNPQLIKFVDTYTSFDVNGAAGQVYRLYQAAFNRKPDLPGLGFWIAANQKGTDLLGIATYFIGSPEFGSLYGTNVSNNSFVNTLYQNILNRAGESGGVTWWVGQLNSGVPKNAVLYGFSDSAENKNNLLAGMQNGFDYVPFDQGGPIIPKKSSYENKMAAGAALGSPTWPKDASDGTAFADFFQDGSYSVVTNTLIYDATNPATANNFGSIHFYKNVNGTWVDNTAALLKDTTGCLHPRKAIVADFNGDGKPDVFFSCHGFDAAPYPGEKQHILLSQADGTYKNTMTDFNCFCHGAAAADFNGDGHASIMVADQQVAKKPYFLMNNGDGSFTQDFTKLPTFADYSQIFSAEFIDVNGDGKYDAFLSGYDIGSVVNDNPRFDQNPTFYLNDGTNNFTNAKTMMLPTEPTFGMTMDIIIDQGNAYILRTNVMDAQHYYNATEIQKVNLSNMTSSIIYSHAGGYPASWIVFYKNQIVSLNGFYNFSVRK